VLQVLEPDADGVYKLSAGVRITAQPKADPATFAKVVLLVMLEDQVAEELEMTAAGDGSYVVEADTNDLPNGSYTMQALADDEIGNREVADAGLMKMIKIGNIRNKDQGDLTLADIMNTLTNGKPVIRTLDDPKPIGGVSAFLVQVYYAVRAQMIVSDSTGAVLATVDGVLTPTTDDPDLKDVLFTWDTSGLNGEFDLAFSFWASPPVVIPAKIVVDNIAPAITIDAPMHGDSVSTEPLIWSNYSDASGIKRVAFVLDGTSGEDLEHSAGDDVIDGSNAVAGNSGTLTVEAMSAIYQADTPLEDGVYTSTVTVEDMAGNESVALVRFVIGEEKAPVVLAFGPQGVITNVTPKIYVSYSDDLSGIDTVVISLNGQELANVEVTDTVASVTPDALDAGDHDVEVVLTDRAGKATTFSWQFTIEADETAPVITAYSPTGSVNTATPTVAVSYTDESNVTSVEFDVAGQTSTDNNPDGSSTFTPTALAEGEAVVTVTVTDEFNNVATATWSFSVVLDSDAPVITAYSPTGSINTATPTVMVSYTDRSDVTRVQFNVAGQTRTLNNPGDSATFTPTALAEGEAVVTVTVTDEFNNVATATWSFNVVLDSDAPVITAYSPTGIVRTTTPTVTISYTDRSDVTRVQFNVAGQTRTLNNPGDSATFTPTALAEGEAAVTATVTDEFDNVATAAWSFIVELDTVAPTIMAMTPQGTIGEAKPVIMASYADDRSGVDSAQVKFYLDGRVQSAAKATDTQVTYTPANAVSRGEHEVKVELQDRAGNQASYEWQFKIEENAPIITSYTPVDGEIVREMTPIVVNYADDMSGVDVDEVKVTLDGTDVTASAKKDASRAAYVPTDALAIGKHTVKVDLADKVGNKTSRQWEFYVEDGTLGVKAPKVYPNPFDAESGEQAKVEFTLTQNAQVTIRIYDFSMRMVRELADEEKQPGLVSWNWDGTTDDGEDLAKGIYFCQIIVKSGTEEPKATVLKIALYR
jgi:HSP20 family molecular chaperone IbpA